MNETSIVEELINGLDINPVNLSYIAETGKINGSLAISLKKAFAKYKKHLLGEGKNTIESSDRIALSEDDAKFIYELLPGWAKDAPEDLSPMQYGTLTREGDLKVIERVKKILGYPK